MFGEQYSRHHDEHEDNERADRDRGRSWRVSPPGELSLGTNMAAVTGSDVLRYVTAVSYEWKNYL